MPIRTPSAVAIACLIAATSAGAQKPSGSSRCTNVADFVDMVDRDTNSVSRVVITDSTFESISRAVAQGALLKVKGRRTSAGDVSTLHLEVWPTIGDSAGPPGQIADVTVQGSDVQARIAAPSRGMQMQHDRLPASGVLYMANNPVFLELMQRQVHLAVGATTTVPALWLFTGGAVDTVRVTRPSADSLQLRLGDTDFELALASDHSILSVFSHPRPGVKGEQSRLIRRDCR